MAILFGFHAVTVRLKTAPQSVSEVHVDATRHAGRHLARHVGERIADVDLAAGDVVAPAIERGGPGEAGDRMLGRRVRRRVRARHVRRDRAVVDDAPAHRALALHDPERLLRAQERAGQVRADDGLPLLEAHVLERDVRGAETGVVEEQVDAAERRLGALEERLHRGRHADVGRLRDRTRRRRAAFSNRRVERLRAATGKDDAVAVSEQGVGDRFADAGTRAGDDGDLVVWRHCPSSCRAAVGAKNTVIAAPRRPGSERRPDCARRNALTPRACRRSCRRRRRDRG